LVERLGVRSAALRTFLSGWSSDMLAAFHQLQPGAKLLYRGFVHAHLADLPAITVAIAPRGRALATICEFRTVQLLPNARESYAVVGAIGDRAGFTVEMRLNRMPLPRDQTEAWLEGLLGVPVVYTPLGLY